MGSSPSRHHAPILARTRIAGDSQSRRDKAGNTKRTRIHNVLLSCNTCKRLRLLIFLLNWISYQLCCQNTNCSVFIHSGVGLRAVRSTPLILLTNVLENLNQYQGLKAHHSGIGSVHISHWISTINWVELKLEVAQRIMNLRVLSWHYEAFYNTKIHINFVTFESKVLYFGYIHYGLH